MKKIVFSVFLLCGLNVLGQKAITNEIRGDFRFSLGITLSNVYSETLDLNWITNPAIGFSYVPSISDHFELQLGITADARGGKTNNPFSKFRSYNAGAMLGLRYKLKDASFGGGINPVYFLDTKRSVPEGGLRSGSLHYSVPHFRKHDVPAYVTADFRLNEKVNLEIRYAASLDGITGSKLPQIHAITVSAGFLLAHRYKRERIVTK